MSSVALLWQPAIDLLASRTRGYPSAEAAFKKRCERGEVNTDGVFTETDLETVMRQIESLEPDGAHDHEGLQSDEEADEAMEYNALRLSANLQMSVEAYIDELHGIPGNEANTRGQVLPANLEVIPVVGALPDLAFGRMSDEEFTVNRANMNRAQRGIFEGVKVTRLPSARRGCPLVFQ
jgi:hypothetical protein